MEDVKLAEHDRGATSMPSLQLRDGRYMPVLAVGTALIEPDIVAAVVSAAIDLGYRHVDTAAIYGNEKQIGDALINKIDIGDVRRDELFISSKLWSTFHGPELAVQACEVTLERLQLDYLDLMMIHNPMTFKEGPLGVPYENGQVQYGSGDYTHAWRGLEHLQAAGLVRSIGVSNFNSEQLGRLSREGTELPVVNQVECHPYLAQVQLEEFCSNLGIKLICYGSLGSAGTPESYRTVGRAVLQDPVVRQLADKYGKTPSQILLRYQLDRSHAVVVKTCSRSRLLENLQVVRFSLARDDVHTLNNLDCGQRHFTFKGMGDTHPNYPFNIPF